MGAKANCDNCGRLLTKSNMRQHQIESCPGREAGL
jgi:hypothetical protein